MYTHTHLYITQPLCGEKLSCSDFFHTSFPSRMVCGKVESIQGLMVAEMVGWGWAGLEVFTESFHSKSIAQALLMYQAVF